jgi:hypothetical protein
VLSVDTTTAILGLGGTDDSRVTELSAEQISDNLHPPLTANVQPLSGHEQSAGNNLSADKPASAESLLLPTHQPAADNTNGGQSNSQVTPRKEQQISELKLTESELRRFRLPLEKGGGGRL